jgi:hypothetical protein
MLGEATDHVEVAVLTLRFMMIVAVTMLAVYLPRLAKGCGVNPGRAQWLGLGCPLILVHGVSGAHNDVLMVALVVAGLAYLTERKVLVAGVLLGAALAVKIPVLVVLPFAALLAGASTGSGKTTPSPAIGRMTLVVAVAASSLIGITLVSGLGWGWINALSVPGTSVQWTSMPTSWGIAVNWLTEPFALPSGKSSSVEVARNVGLAVLGGALITLWVMPARAVLSRYRARAARYHRSAETSDDKPDTSLNARIVTCAGLALLAVIILAPAFHPWYFLWPLTLLAASVTKPRAVLALAVSGSALCFLVLPDGYNLARATVVVGTVAMVLATVAVMVAGARLALKRPASP